MYNVFNLVSSTSGTKRVLRRLALLKQSWTDIHTPLYPKCDTFFMSPNPLLLLKAIEVTHLYYGSVSVHLTETNADFLLQVLVACVFSRPACSKRGTWLSGRGSGFKPEDHGFLPLARQGEAQFFSPSESTIVQTSLYLTPLRVFGAHTNVCARKRFHISICRKRA